MTREQFWTELESLCDDAVVAGQISRADIAEMLYSQSLMQAERLTSSRTYRVNEAHAATDEVYR